MVVIDKHTFADTMKTTYKTLIYIKYPFSSTYNDQQVATAASQIAQTV